jgi:hypothetical protein
MISDHVPPPPLFRLRFSTYWSKNVNNILLIPISIPKISSAYPRAKRTFADDSLSAECRATDVVANRGQGVNEGERSGE